jgi:hypothetical protein
MARSTRSFWQVWTYHIVHIVFRGRRRRLFSSRVVILISVYLEKQAVWKEEERAEKKGYYTGIAVNRGEGDDGTAHDLIATGI